MIPANAYFLGDIVRVNPYWPNSYPDTTWEGRIKAFGLHRRGYRGVLVEALEVSSDPLVEDEQWQPYGALTFLERPRG